MRPNLDPKLGILLMIPQLYWSTSPPRSLRTRCLVTERIFSTQFTQIYLLLVLALTDRIWSYVYIYYLLICPPCYCVPMWHISLSVVTVFSVSLLELSSCCPLCQSCPPKPAHLVKAVPPSNPPCQKPPLKKTCQRCPLLHY